MLDIDLFQLYGEVLHQQIPLPIEDYFQLHFLSCTLIHSLHCLNLLQCKFPMV
jgi:hypothetical protein